ncbi:hypothetical protein GCM10010406_13200 [Streptomyces thermolineatus]|uniref:BRCT domain-containing protein n=1 Tax=Streptomyces thermolineatus TaxID=44033 RepID=A0ABN3L8U5_9ACTN
MLEDRFSASAEPFPWPDSYPAGYAVVDVETTGLERDDRIVSAAVYRLDARGEVEDHWYTPVNPERDPGPVWIHGLTSEVLESAPLFADIAEELSARLDGRIFVAHNALFDWRMVSAEYARLGRRPPVEHRLCTIVLAKELRLPLPNHKLESLAAHYGVRQRRAHHALDDARVLAEAFRPSLHLAAASGLRLPLHACRPPAAPGGGASGYSASGSSASGSSAYGSSAYGGGSWRSWRPSRKRSPCPHPNPGRLHPNGPLVQGMRVAFSGDTETDRELLEDRASEAGLHVAGSVSRLTSLLVTNDPDSPTGKVVKAREHGTPVVDEAAFLQLLATIAPAGTPLDAPQAPPANAPGDTEIAEAADAAEAADGRAGEPPAADAAPCGAASGGAAPARPADRDGAPAAGRQVLVLSGPGERAEAERVRGLLAARGDRVRVNLTRSVDAVVVLPGGEDDPRAARAAAAGLPRIDPASLLPPAAAGTWRDPSAGAEESGVLFSTDASGSPAGAADPAPADRPGPLELVRGGVADLPDVSSGRRWTLSALWREDCDPAPELVALVLGPDGRVPDDSCFVTREHPAHPSGAVAIEGAARAAAALTLRLDALPAGAERMAVALALPRGAGTGFGAVGPVEVGIGPRGGEVFARTVLDAATEERVLVLAEVYRRGGGWRFRSWGQGYREELDEVARAHGVSSAG